jgi:NAD(P)-dependent dehydrogenase (short-subunit alcohol dehydrogenase family)
MSPYSLVVIGSGPGIGAHVARQFVEHGFAKVALVARNQQQLDIDRASVEQALGAGANITVKTYAVDITDTPKLAATLDQISDALGPPEVVFFNAARVLPSTLLEADEDGIIYDFKVCAEHVVSCRRCECQLPPLIA